LWKTSADLTTQLERKYEKILNSPGVQINPQNLTPSKRTIVAPSLRRFLPGFGCEAELIGKKLNELTQ
jgi:hypothetical protein